MSPLGNKVTICFHITFDAHHSLMSTVTCEWEFQRLFNNSSSKFFVVSSDVRKKFPKLARLVSVSFSVHISYKYIADKATRIYVYKFKVNLIKSCIHNTYSCIFGWIDLVNKFNWLYNCTRTHKTRYNLYCRITRYWWKVICRLVKYTTILCPSTSFAFSSSFITFSFLSLN